MNDMTVKAQLDRSLSDLRFSEALRARVRTQIAAQELAPARRPRGGQSSTLRRGFAAALVCAALLVTVLAAGSTVWDMIQAHLGTSAPYAATVAGAVSDQGLELGIAAALTDRNVIRVYFTLRDLTGDRLAEGAELDLWALKRDGAGTFLPSEDAPNGGTPIQQVGYDSETRTLTLCQTFYSEQPLTTLDISVREIVPGNQDFFLQLNGDALASQVPEGTLDSAVDGAGNRYLRPNQNPMELDWEKCPLPKGAEPGISISSMGFAEDGRFHIRFRMAEGIDLTQMDLPQYQGQEMEQTAVLDDGADYAFPEGGPARADLQAVFPFWIVGAYSTQGGKIAGVWDLAVPLESVESVAVTWPGGSIQSRSEARLSVAVEGLWLSPLALTMDARTDGSSSFLWVGEQPVVTLKDGTQAPLRQGDLVFAQGTVVDNIITGDVERIVWEFETPVAPEVVAAIALFGETLDLP